VSPLNRRRLVSRCKLAKSGASEMDVGASDPNCRLALIPLLGDGQVRILYALLAAANVKANARIEITRTSGWA
jgi:hypothetical protein